MAQAAGSRLAGSSDSTMNASDDHCRVPLELRAFVDGVPAVVWSALADGSPEFVNLRLQDYSGLIRDQICGEWTSILHPEDVSEFEKWWRGLQTSGKPGQTE